MDFEKAPNRPIIVSQLQATESAKVWTALHDHRFVEDGDGLLWNLHQDLKEVPHPRDAKQLYFKNTISTSVSVTVQDLLKTGTLNPSTGENASSDQRLVELLGRDSIPLKLKPQVLTSSNKEDLDREVSLFLADFKIRFKKQSLHQVKRNLVARWLDQKCSFAISK